MKRDSSGRRVFTPEFREEAVKLVLECGHKVADVAKMFDIHRNQLDAWIRKYKEAHRSPAPDEVAMTAAEMKRLQRENAELKLERDILKKALAIFSKDPK